MILCSLSGLTDCWWRRELELEEEAETCEERESWGQVDLARAVGGEGEVIVVKTEIVEMTGRGEEWLMMEEGEGLELGVRMAGLGEEAVVGRRRHLARLKVGGRVTHCEGSHESCLPLPLSKSCCWG